MDENVQQARKYPPPKKVISRDVKQKFFELGSFVPTCIIYFIFTTILSSQNLVLPLWGEMIAKILPIFTLMNFVINQHGGDFSAMWRCFFSRCVFLGLCFSMLGDALLIYQEVSTIYFLLGMISFAIGHCMYIFAFSWTPFNPMLLVKYLLIAALLLGYLWEGDNGLKDQPLVMKIGVGFYSAINAAMNWRSWARLSYQDFTDGRWYEFMGSLGAVNFLVSDAILAINKFKFPVPYETFLVMGTYYVAQLGIALSVVDGPDVYGQGGGKEEGKKTDKED